MVFWKTGRASLAPDLHLANRRQEKIIYSKFCGAREIQARFAARVV